MANYTNNHTGHVCPHCKKNQIETIATAPYVRGFILAYQIGSKTLIGCTPCVKKKLFGEAGKSMFLGWLSITSFIINPFLITWNVIQGATIGPKTNEVNNKLKELGVPTNPQAVDITQIGYSLAACMIKADGKVEESEIKMAELIGMKIFPDFNNQKFRSILNSKNLPTIQSLTILLRDIINEEGKILIFKYLSAIAQSDGHVDNTEKTMLMELALGLGLDLQKIKTAA